MDDPTILVEALLNKLAELDQKVCDYRQDMAHEFQRYSQHLLHDAPEHVSARVEEVLADELHNYPALSPGFGLDTASADLGCAATNRSSRRGRARVSPPPILPHTSGVPPNDVTAGSPPDRDRDREFHGVFMPSFLPLLEVMQPNQNISSPSVVASPATPRGEQSNNTRASSHVQLDSIIRRPGPSRNYTEDTTSSITSDDSVSRTRRSALRRSSSASAKDAQSPRRVRFDVEGEEVLPTVSPPTSPPIHHLPAPLPLPEQIATTHGPPNHGVFEEEASILGDSPPRPKKISSTERLKALARSSTEDTSSWTVVGDVHDDDEEEGLVMFSPKRKPTALPPGLPSTNLKNGTDSHTIQDKPPRGPTEQTYDRNIDEDDLLELAPLTSFKDKQRFSPPQDAQEPIPKAKPDENLQLSRTPPDTATLPNSAFVAHSPRVDDLEEVMFSFDDDVDDDDQSTRRRRAVNTVPKYIEEAEDDDQITPQSGNAAEGWHASLLSTSPAIPIAKPASLQPASPASSASNRMGASAGSYKGKPFIIGVVRDEKLHKMAADMGDIQTFVGSVDGRSGMDPSDNYHQAPYYSTGTPRSLGEVLMEGHVHRIANNAHKQE
ncbi:hypothetical protein F4802DRAFT_357858 [Xylaria palmicola]|nr:hypothetical protein F4802DRAFT_357858 [Xylaria palmicola]